MLQRAKRIALAGPQGHSGASNAPGDAHVLTEWLEMRTQDTFLGFWNENQEFSSVDRRKPLAIASLKLHPGIRAVARARGRRRRE